MVEKGWGAVDWEAARVVETEEGLEAGKAYTSDILQRWNIRCP